MNHEPHERDTPPLPPGSRAQECRAAQRQTAEPPRPGSLAASSTSPANVCNSLPILKHLLHPAPLGFQGQSSCGTRQRLHRHRHPANRLQALTPTAGAKPRQNGLNRHDPSLLTHAPSWLGPHAHQPSARLTRHTAGPPHPAAHKNKPLSQQSTRAVTWTSHPDPERQTQT